MIEKMKKLLRVIKGNDFYCKTTIKVCKTRIGSSYGGWWISTDNIKDKNLVVFSFGLGEDISFDRGMIDQFNSNVYGFDPTPKSINYVRSMDLDDRFKLYTYAISDKNGILNFSLPENEEHVSGSLEGIPSNKTIEVVCKNIKTICEELQVNEIDILKMDIEGTEYKVIENMMQSKIYPKQILIEYHHFFDSLSNRDTKESIDLLLSNEYELFHIEAYNYSFIRK